MVGRTVVFLAVLLLSGCLQASDAPEALDGADEDPNDAGGGASDAFASTARWKGTTGTYACAAAPSYVFCSDPSAPDADCCHEQTIPEPAGNATLALSWDDPAGRGLTVTVRGDVVADGEAGDDAVQATGTSPLVVELSLAPGPERSLSVRVVQDLAAAGPVAADSSVDFEAELTFTA